MFTFHDPDEWETVVKMTPCTACNGDLAKCNGMCNGSSSYSYKRRTPEDIAAIKEEKRRIRDAEILAEAQVIMERL